jgi:two-component system, probable response regulator PhcQ
MTQATILYVDDEAMALKYFDRLISPNYRVLTALSVAEGIQILQAQGDDICVLISDQRMPGASGNELLRYARDHHPKILRILTTAYSELGEAIVAINAGEIYRYITKPWDLEMLRTEVRLAVEVSTLRSERDELLHAKIQVQQAQLLANRVNNLTLACGLDAPSSAALQQYLSAIKQLGGVSLEVDWRTLHYTDWMQSEAVRHTAIADHIQHWLGVWQDPSMTDLQSALGDVLSKPQALTDLLSSNSKTPSERDCAALAWFIAVERAGKHSIQMTVTVDGHIRFDLTTYIAPLLAHDWLANAMENLEKPST